MAEAARKIDLLDLRPAFVQADADALKRPLFRCRHDDDAAHRCSPRAYSAAPRWCPRFGTESAVLLHLVAKVDPEVPVVFVDTLKMFPETLAYRDQLIAAFGIRNSWTVEPDEAVLAAKGRQGAALVLRS